LGRGTGLVKRESHFLESEPHPSFNGAERSANHLGDLRMCESSEVGELDHVALVFWQFVERYTYSARLLLVNGNRGRAGLSGFELVGQTFAVGAAFEVDQA
jgi:hypothetical protein